MTAHNTQIAVFHSSRSTFRIDTNKMQRLAVRTKGLWLRHMSDMTSASAGAESAPVVGNITYSFPDVPVPGVVAPALSLSTANKKQLLAYNTKLAVDRFKAHRLDTGSTPVQIAVLTEKINSLFQHVSEHKKDKSTKRGFQALVTRRRTLMQYLRRTNFPLFRDTIITLNLEDVASKMPTMYRKRKTKRGN